MNSKVDQKLGEVLGLKSCCWHHKVHLKASLKWYTPGENTMANTELLNAGVVINGLDNRTECTLGKFVDNTKLGGMADAQDGSVVIQKDLHRPGKQTNMYLMNISTKGDAKSRIWGGIIPHTSTNWSQLAGKQLVEKDPGVLVSTLNMSCIRQSILHRLKEAVTLPFFLALVKHI